MFPQPTPNIFGLDWSFDWIVAVKYSNKILKLSQKTSTASGTLKVDVNKS